MIQTMDWTIIFQWLNILLLPVAIAAPVLTVVLLVLKIRMELRKKDELK